MKELSDFERACEETFGLISGGMIYMLHELSTAAGSEWDMANPSTMEIVVNKSNAESIYATCRMVHSGYSIGYTNGDLAKIKAARKEAHAFLYEEANDPKTPIERKIELVKLTSRSGR